MRYNLSEITDVIQDRRTIYPEFFSDRKVHKEHIERILNNGIWAPTHGNTQPWQFKVFMGSGRHKLADFLSSTYKSMTPDDSFKNMMFEKLKNRPLMAGAVIAVSLKRDPKEKIREIEEIEAVACVIQNMHLTCTAWGLGGFWSTPGFIYENVTRDFLELGDKDKCLGLFYIGYPKDDYEWPKGQRKPIEYYTKWVEK